MEFPSSFLRFLFRNGSAGACFFLVCSVPFAAVGQIEPGEYSWDNPAFRERFTASYGVLSGAEPQIEPADRTFLREEVLPLISSDPEKAKDLILERLQDSASAPMYFLLGNLYLELNDLEASRAALNRAIGLFPDFRRAHRSLAILEFREGNYKASIPHWQTVIRLNGRDDQSYGLLGFAYLDSEFWTAAARSFENAIVHNPESRDLRKGLVSAYVQVGRGKEAAGLIRKLLAEDPDDPELWGLLANQSLLEGNLVRTAAALEAALETSGPAPDRILLLGNVYTSLGLPAKALGAYEQLLEIPSVELSFETAVEPLHLLLRQREWESADRYGQQLRKHFGRDLDATQTNELNAGIVTARLASKPSEQVVATAESYARQLPRNGLLHLVLGDTYRDADRTAEALLSYRKAAAVEDYRYEATLRLAKLLLAENRIDEAIQNYRALQEIRYSAEVDRFLNQLEDFANQ